MVPTADSPREVAETALHNEMKAREILLDAKENVDNPLAKATFEFLANEELKHIEIIKKFAKALSGAGEFDADDLSGTTAAEAKEHIKNIFERFRVSFEEVGAGDQPRLEIYRVAMDMERHGYEFYKRAAEQALDKQARELYDFLGSEEICHFELIQDTHDYLQQPDALMAVEERWMQT